MRLWLFSDHLGTPVVITDAASFARRRIFEPFGRLVAETELAGYAPPVFFTGKRWESAIAMYDFGARWYDPATAAFGAVDPVIGELANPLSMNAYAYVNANPMRYTDSTGRSIDGGPGDFGAIGFGFAFAVVFQSQILESWPPGVDGSKGPSGHLSPRLKARATRSGQFRDPRSSIGNAPSRNARDGTGGDGSEGDSDGADGGGTEAEGSRGAFFLSGSGLAAFSVVGVEVSRTRDIGSGETRNGITYGAGPIQSGFGNGSIFGFYAGAGVEVGWARDFQALFDDSTFGLTIGAGHVGATLFFTNGGDLVGLSAGPGPKFGFAVISGGASWISPW